MAYVTAFVALPYLNKRLPVFIAFVVLYVGVAYFGIPALIRVWRVMFRPNHLPLYATTPDGWPSDPVNIAIVARSKRHLQRVMKLAGWYEVDKATPRNNIHAAWAMLLDRPYPTAPFSPLYLFNRPFDIGFQIPYGARKSPRHRHHARFWQLFEQPKDGQHYSFWHKHFWKFLGRKKTVLIGAAIDDVGAHGIRWRNLQSNHRTHPLHYRERDFIIDSLRAVNHIHRIRQVQAGEPFAIRGQNIGTEPMICDGKLTIVELKSGLLNR